MAKLIFSVIESLDGYVADSSGGFDWAEPDESLHTFVNDLERSVGAYLYGRRMYEVMAPGRLWAVWATSRHSSRTTRGFGGRRARSSTPRRSTRCPASERGSSGRLTRRRSSG